MAITAGNYIIRSAIDEDMVLLTSGGSTAKGAAITAGSLTESDNRCYWKCSVVSTSYNRFYNLKTGSTSGYMMVKTVSVGNGLSQGAYKIATGGWLATLSGNTMTVNGVSVNTYYLSSYTNSNLYLTVPENGGNLYLSPLLDDTTQQEFYFDASTYVNNKLATPTELTINGSTYIVYSSSSANAIYPQWKSASTSTIYEMRSRTRRYDMDGVAEEWSAWTAWTMITASKLSAGIMKTTTSVSAPAVDNTTYSQADIQIDVRLTSAKNAAGYNKTGTITHGPAVSAVIRKWRVPSFSVTAAQCTQYGLKVTYDCNYTIAGNMIRFVSVTDGATELIANYVLTNQDYTGDVLIDWDFMADIPAENDSLSFVVQLVESNGYVSVTSSATLTVTYDSSVGFVFTPIYTATNRMTVEAKLPAYTSIECYMKRTDLEGNEVWTACEEIDSGDPSYRMFEIVPAFGSAPDVMWIVSNVSGGNTQWGYKIETLSTFNFNTLYYVWNWVDDAKQPHAYIMKYRANAIVQPQDAITLPATKYTTTGREYPIFRYSKSVDRSLDIEGAILNNETGAHSTRSDAEKLAVADHTTYRQPNGKWYQTALKSVTFTREIVHDVIQIAQEAESR